MGPAAKYSGMQSKRLCKASEAWLDEDAGNACKNKRRKLPDMLKHRWSEGELKQFYNAFRKYGKNWKKVAELMRKRSVEMVESLYYLNRAYLSLPEGMATADGFIAMMTDHYSNLDTDAGSNDSNDASEKTLNHKKHRVKCQLNKLKVNDGRHWENQSYVSSCRCASKTYSGDIFTDMWPRVAGKRTPRIRISNSQGNGDSSVSTKEDIIKLAPNEYAYVTLLEASQDGGLLLPSGSSGKSVLSQSVNGKHAEADMATPSDTNVQMDENCLDGHSERLVVNSDFVGRDTKQLDIGGIDPCGSQCKVTMLPEVRPKVRSTKDLQFNVFGACNDREKGFKGRKSKDKIDKEVSEKVMVQPSPHLSGKHHLLLLGDKVNGLDPLQMLANVSLNMDMQDSAGIHQSVNRKISFEEDKGYSSAVNDMSDITVSLPVTSESDDSKILVQEYRIGCPLQATKLGKAIFHDEISVKNVLSEKDQDKLPYISIKQHNIAANRWIPKGEVHDDSGVNECKKNQEEVQKETGHMNADASRRGTDGELAAQSKSATEHGKKVTSEVASASFNREQCIIYNKKSRPPWFRPSESLREYGGSCGFPLASDVGGEDPDSNVMEIARSFRQKARNMVDAAVLAMSSLKEGEDAYTRITDALDCADNQQHGVDYKILGTRYSRLNPLACQNQAKFAPTVNAFNPVANHPTGNEAQILSELISDCIATVFMIQATSERPYPPAPVARVLEDAVESLQPRCLQNLPVYREIEKCMGYIKTQILVLVATPKGSIPTDISV